MLTQILTFSIILRFTRHPSFIKNRGYKITAHNGVSQETILIQEAAFQSLTVIQEDMNRISEVLVLNV